MLWKIGRGSAFDFFEADFSSDLAADLAGAPAEADARAAADWTALASILLADAAGLAEALFADAGFAGAASLAEALFADAGFAGTAFAGAVGLAEVLFTDAVFAVAAFAGVFPARAFAAKRLFGTGGSLNVSTLSPTDSTRIVFASGSAETIRYVSNPVFFEPSLNASPTVETNVRPRRESRHCTCMTKSQTGRLGRQEMRSSIPTRRI